MADANTHGLTSSTIVAQIQPGELPVITTGVACNASKSAFTMAPHTVTDVPITTFACNGVSPSERAKIYCDCHESGEFSGQNGDMKLSITDSSTPNKVSKINFTPLFSPIKSTRSDLVEYNAIHRRQVQSRVRLHACAHRLRHIRQRTAELAAQLVDVDKRRQLAGLVATAPNVGSFLLREMSPEETETSSDEDAHENTSELPSRLSSQDQWYCTRSVIRSNWFWIQSEICRAERSLQNLLTLEASCRRWRESSCQQGNQTDLHPNFSDTVSASCVRTHPYSTRASAHHSYHDLLSNKCSGAIISAREGASLDTSVRCSCKAMFTGPCILCCGSGFSKAVAAHITRDTDLIERSSPLDSSIHRKLSAPSDILLTLRIESRLVQTPVFLREQRTTIYPVSPSDRPGCLQGNDSLKGQQSEINRKIISEEALKNKLSTTNGYHMWLSRRRRKQGLHANGHHAPKMRWVTRTTGYNSPQSSSQSLLEHDSLLLPRWRLKGFSHCMNKSKLPGTYFSDRKSDQNCGGNKALECVPGTDGSLKLIELIDDSEDTSDELYNRLHAVGKQQERDRIMGTNAVRTGNAVTASSRTFCLHQKPEVPFPPQVTTSNGTHSCIGFSPRLFPLTDAECLAFFDCP